MQLKAAIFNDTSHENHHGCHLVMENLVKGLASNYIQTTLMVPNRYEFWLDPILEQKLSECDLIVINGEGTFHGGSAYAERLLKLATDQTLPVFLVNVGYHNNPVSWKGYLQACRGVYARDSESARQISAVLGRHVGWLPDISISDPNHQFSSTKTDGNSRIIFGDSVLEPIGDFIAAQSRRNGGLLVPTMSSPIRVKQGRTGLRRKLNIISSDLARAASNTIYSNRKYVKSHKEYVGEIEKASLHITGRFHGVCISVLTRTPFVTFEANTPKITNMLRDIGLGDHRCQSEFHDLDVSKAHTFSLQEIDLIDQYCDLAHLKAKQLFKEIRETLLPNSSINGGDAVCHRRLMDRSIEQCDLMNRDRASNPHAYRQEVD